MAGITVRELVTKLTVKGDGPEKMKRFTKSVDIAKKALIGLVVGATAAGVAVVALVNDVSKFGDEVAKMSATVGLSGKALQRLKFAADRSGVPLVNLRKGLQNIQRNLREGALAEGQGKKTSFTVALAEVGLRMKDLQGLNPEETIGLFGEALARVADQGRRVAISQRLVGEEAGPRFAKLLAEGRTGIKGLGDEFERLGFVLDEDALKASEDMQDSFLNLQTVLRGVQLAVGVQLIPIVEKGVKSFTNFALANRKVIAQGAEKFVAKLSRAFDFLLDNAEAIARNFEGLIDLFGRTVLILSELIEGMGGLERVIKLAAVAWGTYMVAQALALGPVGIAAAALIALAVAFGSVKNEADLAREAQERFNRGTKEQIPLNRNLAKANAARLAADVKGGKALTPALEQSLIESSSLQLQETLKVAANILKGGRRATGKRFGGGEFSGFSSQVKALQRGQRTAGADLRTLSLIRESLVLDRAQAQAQKRPAAAKPDEPVFGIAGTELDPSFGAFDFRPSRLPTKEGKQGKEGIDELIANAIRSGKLPEEAALLASTQPPIIIPITNNNFNVDVQAPVTLNGLDGETAEEMSGRFAEAFQTIFGRVLSETMDVVKPKAAR